LNEAQNDIFNEFDLRFQEANQDYTVTTNVSDITNGSGLPAGFIQAIDLTNTTSGYERVIPYKDYREIDDFLPDPDDTTLHPANIPEFWYLYADTIRLYPRPNQAFTLTLRYKQRPTDLSDDADVPLLPAEFQEYLILGAAYRVYEVKDNFVQSAYLKQRCDEIALKLVQRYARKQTGRPTRMRLNGHASGS
jgi:hypothetical protein